MNGRTRVRLGLVAAGTVAAALSGMSGASAAQGYQPLDCSDDSSIVVRVPDTHSSDHGGWSVGQIIDGGSGHLIPTSFTFSAYDATTDMTIFSSTQAKGGGNANRMQTSVTCTSVQTGTAAELLGPDLPPGVAAGDTLTFTIAVVAVPKT